MSASKEAFTSGTARGASGAGWHRGRGFERARPGRPCPICGRKKKCSLRDDGAVHCTKVPSPHERENDLGRYWIHYPNGRGSAPRGPRLEPAPLYSAARADADGRHRVYSALLARCPLSPAHREQLLARGFTPEQVTRGGYGSLPGNTAAVARELVREFGEDLARKVPGLVVAQGPWGQFWALSARAGLLIPARDLAGRIGAIRVRSEGPGAKYFYLTSASERRQYQGPRAECVVHVPPFDGPRDVVRVTEGELKGDLATTLSGTLTLSVPGVSLWRAVLPVVAELRPRRVLVAFDMDATENPDVARATRDLVHALYSARYRVALEEWPYDPATGRFKGIDDYLAHRAREASAHG